MPLAAIYAPWEWVRFGPFAFQPGFSLHYVVFFFAGLGVGVQGLEQGLLGQSGALARHWGRWAGAAVGTFFLWMIPTALTTQGFAFPGLRTLADLGLTLATAANCFALAAVFIRFGGKRQPVADSLSVNAYGIYLVHYPFVIWLQFALLSLPLPAIAKGLLVFAGALALSWGTSAGLSRTAIGARLIGSEPRTASKAQRAKVSAG
jgi:peptidoglycan/LPS O-acetylase OafA/YrhL